MHGPEYAERELNIAYNAVVECETAYDGRSPVAGVHSAEASGFYLRAFRAYRDGDRLSAERLARATKHLARAFWHEAKIAHLERHSDALPFLTGTAAASREEFHVHEYEHRDTGLDFLDSLQDHIPNGLSVMPDDMIAYLRRARNHLEILERPLVEGTPDASSELLRAERIKAAHEYGRTVECLALAYSGKRRAA